LSPSTTAREYPSFCSNGEPGEMRLTISSDPRTRGRDLALEGGDLGTLLHGRRDIVEPLEQHMPAGGVDIEMDSTTVRTPDRLGLEVDRDGGIGAALGIVHQKLQLLGRHLDRQNAVLEAVVVEDVGKAGGVHAAHAEIE